MTLLSEICWNGIAFTVIICTTITIIYYLTLKYIVHPNKLQKTKEKNNDQLFKQEKYWAIFKTSESTRNELQKEIAILKEEKNKLENEKKKLEGKKAELEEKNKEIEIRIIQEKIKIYEEITKTK